MVANSVIKRMAQEVDVLEARIAPKRKSYAMIYWPEWLDKDEVIAAHFVKHPEDENAEKLILSRLNGGNESAWRDVAAREERKYPPEELARLRVGRVLRNAVESYPQNTPSGQRVTAQAAGSAAESFGLPLSETAEMLRASGIDADDPLIAERLQSGIEISRRYGRRAA